MSAESDQQPPAWLTTMTEHEGFPLALRVRPSADTPENRNAFRLLGVVTHQMAEVRDNGLPATEYNESLEEFDLSLQDAVGEDNDGLVVLIETFAGKRTYYAYVQDSARLQQRIHRLSHTFPEHKLSIICKQDAEWRFYASYRNQFRW